MNYGYLRCTVCIEADAYCSAKWPADNQRPEETPLEVLIIDLGDRYRLDFLAENTIVGLKSGEIQKADQAAILRDDRNKCGDVARMAYEWYQTNRQTLDVSFRQIRSLFELGMLITTIGAGATTETVNTLISSITYDLKEGTMAIVTADEDLDHRALT